MPVMKRSVTLLSGASFGMIRRYWSPVVFPAVTVTTAPPPSSVLTTSGSTFRSEPSAGSKSTTLPAAGERLPLPPSSPGSCGPSSSILTGLANAFPGRAHCSAPSTTLIWSTVRLPVSPQPVSTIRNPAIRARQRGVPIRESGAMNVSYWLFSETARSHTILPDRSILKFSPLLFL